MSDDTNEYIIEPDNSSGNSSPQSNNEPVSDNENLTDEEESEEERNEVDEYTDVNYHQNQIKNVLGDNRTSTPQNVKASQFWFDEIERVYKYFDGECIIRVGNQESYNFISPGIGYDDETSNVFLEDATTTNIGGVRYATDNEAHAGVVENKTVNPKQLVSEINIRLSAFGSEIEDDIEALESTINSIGTRLTTAERNITTNTNNISSLGTRMSTAEGNITSLGSRMTTAENNITTNTNNISSLGTRMTTAEGKITTLENAVSGVETLLHTINSGGN